MNPWGFAIAFVGFLLLYMGVKGNQQAVIAAFRPLSGTPNANGTIVAGGASSDFTTPNDVPTNGKTRETPK